MANRSTKKSKKPLQTSLGRAASNAGEKIDLSHVRKPIHTSIYGLSEVLSLHKTGTPEVIHYIDNECDLIYECRVCHTLFRSIANFILHKREYCREQFSAISQYSRSFHQESTVLHISDKNSDTATNSPNKFDGPQYGNTTGNTLASVISKLRERQGIEELSKKIIDQDLSEANEDTSSISNNSKAHDLLVEEIGSNNVAVFQTLMKSVSNKDNSSDDNMKSQVMEIHTIMGKDEAVIGPDGKLFTLQATDKTSTTCKTDLICPECKLKFATRKTLTYHIKYKHNKTRRVFVCPDCKGHFANAWSVYRHLYKIHRRTAGYIKRMRDQINNSVISKEIENVNKKEKTDSEKVDSTDEENQWLNNIEGDKDFQMCGGCGKRFERKAALHSHAQMCIKRIAVCNSIKENSAKRKEEENKDKNKVIKVDKALSPELSQALKGASKRKPYLLRTYKKPSDMSVINNEEKTSDFCDVNANSKVVEINCDISSATLTNGSLIKNEAIVLDNANSPDAKLNTSDNLENFRGFSRECIEVEPGRMFERDEDSDVNNSNIVNWNSTGKFLPLSSLLSTVEKRSKIIPKQIKSNENNLPPDIESGMVERNITDKPILLNVNQEPFTEFNKTNGKITIRNMADLAGIPSIDKDIKNPRNRNDFLKEFEFKFELNKVENIPETVKMNVSPKILKNTVRTSKRKRSITDDIIPSKQNQGNVENDSLSKEQDINFVDRAAPYIDRKNLLCKPCKKCYPTFAKLLWHMSGHFSWFRFQCSRCSFISFSKSDCAKHAKVTHYIRPKDLQGVVLPIPNWKIALMAHDFSDFTEENDLSGKHTDEVIIDECDEEEDIIEENKYMKSIDSDKNITTLFIDLEENEDNCSSYPYFPQPMEDHSLTVKNEVTDIDEEKRDDVIDIVEDTNESFLIQDLPQEIYSSNIFDVFPQTVGIESTQCNACSKSNDEDLFKKYLIPKTKDIEIVLMDDIKEEVQDSLEGNVSPHRFFEDEDEEEYQANVGFNGAVDSHEDNAHIDHISSTKLECNNCPTFLINTRPTRNRTRSIKTRHDDFFYELNKTVKPSEPTNTKNIGNQKVKKTSGVVSPKSKLSSPKSARV